MIKYLFYFFISISIIYSTNNDFNIKSIDFGYKSYHINPYNNKTSYTSLIDNQTYSYKNKLNEINMGLNLNFNNNLSIGYIHKNSFNNPIFILGYNFKYISISKNSYFFFKIGLIEGYEKDYTKYYYKQDNFHSESCSNIQDCELIEKLYKNIYSDVSDIVKSKITIIEEDEKIKLYGKEIDLKNSVSIEGISKKKVKKSSRYKKYIILNKLIPFISINYRFKNINISFIPEVLNRHIGGVFYFGLNF